MKSYMRFPRTRSIVASIILLVLVLCTAAIGGAAEDASVDAFIDKWAAELPIKNEVQTFSAEEGIMQELVVATEKDALKTAVRAISRIEGIDANALSEYTPDICFKAIGTEYTYDVKLSPAGAGFPFYYVEVSASFEDNMVRYHVLNAEGTQTISIKFFSGPNKDIKEQSYDEYTKERAGG